MEVNTQKLFEPVSLGARTLRNRLAMSPMTREFSPGGVLPEEAVEYYTARARGGVGLVITEATTIPHETAHYSGREPHFFGEAPMARWKRVVDAVHAEGAAIYPQLWHTGISRKRRQTHNPEVPSLGPSTISSGDLSYYARDGRFPDRTIGTPPRAATEADIEAVITAFGDAAETARATGFDGVAVHGAHGYLIHQFYWDRSNDRTDRWGGSPGNRARLGLEVVREIRRRVGADFPIMFRFSQWSGWDYSARPAATPQDLERFLVPLAEAGVDVFDASTRRFWLPEFEGSPLNLAGWAKKLTGRLAMTVGSVGLEEPIGTGKEGAEVPVAVENIRRLMMMIERGDFDMVAVGRGLIANPNWVTLIRENRWDELIPYDAAQMLQTL